MKPRIFLGARLRDARGPYQRIWFCCNLLSNGKPTGFRSGRGFSPQAAYKAWARMNNVNPDS